MKLDLKIRTIQLKTLDFLFIFMTSLRKKTFNPRTFPKCLQIDNARR